MTTKLLFWWSNQEQLQKKIILLGYLDWAFNVLKIRFFFFLQNLFLPLLLYCSAASNNIVLCILGSVHCTVCNVVCSVYNVQCTTMQCSLSELQGSALLWNAVFFSIQYTVCSALQFKAPQCSAPIASAVTFDSLSPTGTCCLLYR